MNQYINYIKYINVGRQRRVLLYTETSRMMISYGRLLTVWKEGLIRSTE